MKILLSLFFALFSCLGFSQEEEKPIYFPQEKLIHPKCSKAVDKKSCLEKLLAYKIDTVLTKKAAKTNLQKKDTLTIELAFSISDNGNIIKDNISLFVNDKKIKRKILKPIKIILDNLPTFDVLNHKKRPYHSRHTFNFKYLKTSKKDSFTRIEIAENNYDGGVIIEYPIFPGCTKLEGQKSSDCFNKKLQAHIKENFLYPKEASLNNIQGIVSIMFTINGKGLIENVKTKAPHSLLDNEARRIVNLLPIFEPGKENGVRVKFPFSFPMTFKLD